MTPQYRSQEKLSGKITGVALCALKAYLEKGSGAILIAVLASNCKHFSTLLKWLKKSHSGFLSRWLADAF